jgi:hypothetical protein
MLLNKRGFLRTKYLIFFLQYFFLTSFVTTVLANAPCGELITSLVKTKDKVSLNGGLWESFEKDSFLKEHSSAAIQLESRINKIFFTLSHICKTKDGIPLNDLASYISLSISDKGRTSFKEELIALGKTNQQIESWFVFFEYAQRHRFRTLDSSVIRKTIDQAIPFINKYTSIAIMIKQSKSPEILFKMTRTLISQIDVFFSSDPYIIQALEEISHVPYWDINESSGGS